MPIKMSFWEKCLWHYSNQAPGIIPDYFSALGFRVVDAAMNLHFFDILQIFGPLTREELAEKISASPKGVELMLNALESLGYVKKKQHKFMNSALTTKWLTSQSPESIQSGVTLYKKLLFERMESLEQTILDGHPQSPFWEWLNQMSEGWKIFQEGMVAGAKISAAELFSKISFPQTTHRIMDIGGGHGLYSIKVCEMNPHLTSLIVDLPQSLAFGQSQVREHHLCERILFQQLNFEVDPLPQGFDTILVFNILHGYDETFILELFHKIRESLNEWGRLIILDLLIDLPRGKFNQAVAQLMAINLFNDVGGGIHSLKNLKHWLGKSGYEKIRVQKLFKSPFSFIEAYTYADSLAD